MVQSLTDWLKQSRLIVVAVEMDKGRVRVKGDGDVCSDLSCGEQTLVVSDEDPTGSLESLNPGDIVKVERAAGTAGPHRRRPPRVGGADQPRILIVQRLARATGGHA